MTLCSQILVLSHIDLIYFEQISPMIHKYSHKHFVKGAENLLNVSVRGSFLGGGHKN